MSCHINPCFSPSVHSLLTLTISTILFLPFLLCMALVYVLSQLFLNLEVPWEIDVKFMQMCCIKNRPWIMLNKMCIYGFHVSLMMTSGIFWLFSSKSCIAHVFLFCAFSHKNLLSFYNTILRPVLTNCYQEAFSSMTEKCKLPLCCNLWQVLSVLRENEHIMSEQDLSDDRRPPH